MLHTRIRQLPGSGRAVTTGYPDPVPGEIIYPSHLYCWAIPCRTVLILSRLFQLIMTSGCIPSDFKHSYFVPIPENRRHPRQRINLLRFYRGIAISSIISKVIYVVANPSEEEIAVNYPVHTWTENASSNSCEISRVDRCVFGFSSWLSTMSSAFSMTNHFSISEHQWTCDGYYQQCAQSLYALKVLRCHGMGDDALMIIFRSVVLAKILYASPAWWGFANSSDKQRLEAFMRRCVRLNFYRQDDSTVDQLVADLDDGFVCLLNDQHVLRCILPERNTHSYSLGPRRHELVLTTKRDSRNFFERQLFTDMYWYIVQLRSVSCFSKIKVKWRQRTLNFSVIFLRHLIA